MTFIQNMKIEINNFSPGVLIEQNERNDFPPFRGHLILSSKEYRYQDIRKML